jgi:hypothetical protein
LILALPLLKMAPPLFEMAAPLFKMALTLFKTSPTLGSRHAGTAPALVLCEAYGIYKLLGGISGSSGLAGFQG